MEGVGGVSIRKVVLVRGKGIAVHARNRTGGGG